MAAGASSVALANETIDPVWYGAGGVIDDYALVSRSTAELDDINSPNYNPSKMFTPSPEQWRDRNIYQLFTDRFATDGNIRVKSYRPAWDCEYTGDGLNRSYPFNRNYHHGGSWKGLQYQIPYLQKLGVTAVWISGVQQNDQSVTDNRWTPYHQYHVDNFFRCDPAMGTFQDLKDVIDALHAAGIAVILDVAPNHMCDKNGWGTKDEDKQFHWNEDGRHWWDNNNKHCAPFDNLDRFHVQGTINNWDSHPENKIGQFKGTDDLKQEDSLTSDYLYRAFKNLIDATDCDGFRVDAIKHIEYDWCRNWAQAMRDHAAWRGKKNFLMFGELFSYDHGALSSWCADGYGFNSALLFPLMQAMNNAFGNGYSTYQLGEEMNRLQMYGAGKENAIAFLDNHDVNRFAMAFAANNAGHAKWIMKPAMTFLYLAPPVPLLYYGTEHMFDQGGHGNGSNRSWDDSNADDSDWQRECMFNRGFQPGNAGGDKFSDAAWNDSLCPHIAWLNDVRNHSRALRRGGFEQRAYSGEKGLYAFTKWYDDETALVVLNTSDDKKSQWIYTGRPNTEFEVFYSDGTRGTPVTSTGDGTINVELDGKDSRIYIHDYNESRISDVFPSGGGSSGSGVWISGTYGFPTENATSDDTIYINTEAGPTNLIDKIEVIYYLNPTVGGDWPASETGTRTNMTVIPDWTSQAGAWWHAEIKGITGSGTLHYCVVATPKEGEAVWDNNRGRNYQLTISEPPVSIGAKFQSVSANPVEPDDGGSVTVTATMKADDGEDVSALSVSMDYAFVTKSITGSTTSEWTHVTLDKGTTSGNTINFTTAISNLPGGTTLIYKLEATNGGTDKIQANGGNAYETRITGTITGVTGVCWHCPTNHEPWADYSMRFPVTPKEGWTMYLRVGNYQGSDASGDNPLDMNAGKLYYRFGAGETWTEWQSVGLNWECRPDDGPNNFWVGTCDIPAGQAGNFLQYYFEIDYDNVADLATTYLYMHPDDSAMYLRTTSKAEAEATPFEVGIAGAADGDEPGFIWHGGNITRSANDTVQIWAKIGYLPDNGAAWADEAVIRYRIDIKKEGKARSAGVKAVKSKQARAARSWKALTGQAAMTMKSTVADGAGKGQAMMWMGTITDERLLDDNAVLIYEVYARNSKGNGNWKQAEYNAGDGSCTFEYRMFSDGSGDLTVDGEPADYTTSKFFIDEADTNDTVSVVVEYHAPNDADEVELFTNFGRRDYADTDWDEDGWPDGMIPPDRDSVTRDNCADGYWQAIKMTKGTGAYTATLTTGKCGVYRITARYKAAGSNKWTYYSDNPNGTDRRDHVVVISPKKAMQQTMYELNVLTTKAAGASNTESGNFEDLSERLTATADDPYGEFSIDYLNRMGVNCLWFQPIHPNLDYARGNTNASGDRYYPGSPYATKNYFSVNYEMTKTKNTAGLSVEQMEANAVTAFTNFVRLCDQAQPKTALADGVKNLDTINVMLDGVMNHTSFDAVYGDGITLALAGLSDKAKAELTAALGAGWDNVSATNVIPATKLGIQWYSHVVDATHNQDAPATHYVDENDNDIANAPERYDFGKWNDVAELLYGNYSTMVRFNDMVENEWWDDQGRHTWTELGPETSRIYSEEDKYYYDEMLPATKLLWKYMASYPEYWIKKTGNDGVNHPGQKVNGVFTDDYGIDGLRCDYAQGLPNQFWEYCINRTRSMKWNFLFMAESLDGGKVGFRSNRQFDILNENMVFRFTQDHVSDPGKLAEELENRRQAYGNGLILLNETCHDEVIPWGDPQATASRYAMVSAVDGVPMIFYGQEQAISTFVLGGWGDDGKWHGDNPDEGDKWKGFLKFESNFGKWIPHFKKWNKMLVWDDMVYSNGTANASRDIAAFYGKINLARQKSPALQSQNRWFCYEDMNTKEYCPKIMFCAKWEDEGKNPNEQDAVFAAVLFLNDFPRGDEDGHAGAMCTYDISAFAAKMGIENRADRFYNIKNIASTNDAYVWGDEPKSGKDLYSNGFFVWLQGSHDNGADLPASEWTENGRVVQYLKVYDVTGEVPPVAPDGLTINDPSDTLEVANATATYDVEGMAGDDIVGDITWTNAATGAHGTFAKSTVWTQSVALVTGENIITVSAQSKSGGSCEVIASVNGTNSVAGFGDFVNSTEGTGGLFVHDNASATGISGFENNHAFGLWANSGSAAVFTRAIDAAGEVQSVGVTLGMRYNNQDGVDGNDKGVQFIDAAGNAIFGVKQGDGQAVRYWYGSVEGTWSTSMGDTSAAFDVVLTKTANGYAVSGTKRDGGQFAGLNIETTAKVAGLKFWMNGVSNDDGLKDYRQLYFNNLRYTAGSGTSETVTDTVKIVVAEADKEAPVFTVGEIPTNAVAGGTVAIAVTAAGEGNPTVSVTAATVDGKAYSGYTYSAGSGTLVFTPQVAGEYKFDFLATNTSADKNTATTNIAISVASPPADAPVQIDSIVSFDLATGKASVKISGKDVASLENVPYWTTDVAGLLAGNWTLTGYAPIENGEVQVDLIVPDSGALFLTFCRPPQKD
jgi:glycosidase